MVVAITESHVDHCQALEVVAYVKLICHTDATVDLYGFLADLPGDFADLCFGN